MEDFKAKEQVEAEALVPSMSLADMTVRQDRIEVPQSNSFLPKIELVDIFAKQASTPARTEAAYRQLINNLDSENYRSRAQSHVELRREGTRALPYLLQAYGNDNSGRSLEGTRRIQQLISSLINSTEGGSTTVSKLVSASDSADRQLALGARRIVDGLSMEALLNAAGDQSGPGLTDSMRSAIKRKDPNWKSTLEGYLKEMPETAEGYRQSIAAAAMLGADSHEFNLSLVHGRRLLEQHDPNAARTLDRSIDALQRLANVPDSAHGILNAIDFRQQLQDHMNSNKVTPALRQDLNRLLERAGVLEQRFRKLYQTEV